MKYAINFHEDIERFLFEELHSSGDITSDALFTDEHATAHIIARQSCILAGIQEITQLFQHTGAIFNPEYADGQQVEKNQQIGTISGSARAILKAERLALNILGRMSGIATETHKLTTICQQQNHNIQIAATRKTTPGFRYYEKKAVEIGGGEPHRFGLFDAVLIKDNHINFTGSIKAAIEKIQQKLPEKSIEIEVEKKQDALTAARMNVSVIMLDNMSAAKAKETATHIRSINPNILIEVSGGITKDNITEYCFADRISLGYLTHSIASIDFSLEFL